MLADPIAIPVELAEFLEAYQQELKLDEENGAEFDRTDVLREITTAALRFRQTTALESIAKSLTMLTNQRQSSSGW